MWAESGLCADSQSATDGQVGPADTSRGLPRPKQLAQTCALNKVDLSSLFIVIL